jgi:hypothetical protein
MPWRESEAVIICFSSSMARERYPCFVMLGNKSEGAKAKRRSVPDSYLVPTGEAGCGLWPYVGDIRGVASPAKSGTCN